MKKFMPIVHVCVCACDSVWEWAWHIRKLKRQRRRRRATCKQIYQLRDAAAHQELATISVVPTYPHFLCCPAPLIVTPTFCQTPLLLLYNPNPASNLNARFIPHLNHAWKSLLLSTAKGSIPLQWEERGGREDGWGCSAHGIHFVLAYSNILPFDYDKSLLAFYAKKKPKLIRMKKKPGRKATVDMPKVLYTCWFLYASIVAMQIIYNWMVYVQYNVSLWLINIRKNTMGTCTGCWRFHTILIFSHCFYTDIQWRNIEYVYFILWVILIGTDKLGYF